MLRGLHAGCVAGVSTQGRGVGAGAVPKWDDPVPGGSPAPSDAQHPEVRGVVMVRLPLSRHHK